MEKLYYMAHKARPEKDETIGTNLAEAKAFLGALRKMKLHIIAPWISCIEAMDDQNKEDREFGIATDLKVIERCDGIILVGKRLSSGMKEEKERAEELGLEVIDLIGYSRASALYFLEW